jgi:hypothetical protein
MPCQVLVGSLRTCFMCTVHWAADAIVVAACVQLLRIAPTLRVCTIGPVHKKGVADVFD